VVESMRRGVSHSLFPRALDILSGSSLASGFDERFDRDHSALGFSSVAGIDRDLLID
jgi:hypothetical protein